MKKSVKNLQVAAMTSGLLTLGSLVGCAEIAPTAVEGETKSAIVPDANLVLYYDAEKIRGTKISEAFAALGKEAEKWGGQEMQSQQLRELQKQFEEEIGLKKEDITSILLSMNMNDIDFDAPEPPDLQELDMMVAVSLKKAVSGEELVDFIKNAAAENDQEMEISETTHNDNTIYTLENIESEPAAESEVSGISFAMIASNMIGLLGPESALKDAIDRSASGEMAELTPQMQELQQNLETNTNAYALFTMTPAMKELAKEAQEEQSSSEQSMATFQQALNTLEGASLEMIAGDQADIELTCTFAEQEGAKQMTAFLENTVISSIRMFASMMIEQRPLPLLQTLEAAQQENRAHLNLTISEDDIQTIRKLAEEGAMEGLQAE